MIGLNSDVLELLHEGTVIPAHPLALDENRVLDEAHQRLLTRYYLASGVGGIAVGVHTTQFEIREPRYNLFEKVLQLAVDEVRKASLTRPFIKVAGICGGTNQAVEQAKMAKRLGYYIGLLIVNGMGDWSAVNLQQDY